MAETESPETLANQDEETKAAPPQEMEIEAQAADDTAAADDGAAAKRAREEADADEDVHDEASKKPKVEDKSIEEEEKKSVSDPEHVKITLVGPKTFGSSVEMYDYFYKLLNSWTPNVNVNKSLRAGIKNQGRVFVDGSEIPAGFLQGALQFQALDNNHGIIVRYEHVMLLELLKKGHSEADKKIGSGARSFQIRFHPRFRSRCFFIIREDESVDDFSFRKCVDHILPLPEDMQVKQDVDKALGRGRGGGGRRGGRGYGRGRGGRHRN